VRKVQQYVLVDVDGVSDRTSLATRCPKYNRMMMALNKYYLLVRHHFDASARRLWKGLPISPRSKNKFKHRLFRNFPYIFRRFQFYSDWQTQNPPITNPLLVNQPPGSSIPDELDITALKAPSQRILVVSNDAQAFGGPYLALGIVRALKQDLDLDVRVILLGGGRLKSEFAALAPVYELNEFDSKISGIKSFAESLVQHGFTRAIVNTTVSGWIVPILSDAGIECLCLVHELSGAIRTLGIEKQAKQIASFAKLVVFPAKIVADEFAEFAQVDSDKQVIRPQGLYRKNRWRPEKEQARAALRKHLGLSLNTKIVLAVGYATYRKGVDLFVECALEILAQRSDVAFVWVGPWDARIQNDIESKLAESLYKDRIHFVGFKPDTAIYHAGSDVYAMTSREDPFPNVVLESFDVGVPVVAFSSSGGAASLVEDIGGITVPPQNVVAFSAAIARLLDSSEFSADLGKSAQEYVDLHFAFRAYVLELCTMLGVKLPTGR